jgi:nickel/cobalt exporter
MGPLIQNPLSWMYFPTALGLGALHALEPGHAKTLTAAYLIGIKGTKRDALFLGLSVAATHSLVVVGISAAALWVGREAFTENVSHWLQLGSGAIVVLLGSWMLVKRILQMKRSGHDHHHAPEPIQIKSALSSGILEIINTPHGERMRYLASAPSTQLQFRVIINRPDGLEVIALNKGPNASSEFLSDVAPNEPHEFTAEFEISHGKDHEVIPFEMHEPEGHHDHSLMTDDEHARAHAATIPEYAKKGERPSLAQILAFGAAGGMIPCPASITVMLLALSIGKFASGLFAVAGFSMGLAIALVGIGLIVVAGISRLQHGGGRPIISAIVVIISGVAALTIAH